MTGHCGMTGQFAVRYTRTYPSVTRVFSHNIITLHAKVLTFSRGYSQPLWGLHSYTPNPLIP